MGAVQQLQQEPDLIVVYTDKRFCKLEFFAKILFPHVPILLVNPVTNKQWDYQPFVKKGQLKGIVTTRTAALIMPPCNAITGVNAKGSAMDKDAQYIVM